MWRIFIDWQTINPEVKPVIRVLMQPPDGGRFYRIEYDTIQGHVIPSRDWQEIFCCDGAEGQLLDVVESLAKRR